MERLSKHFGPVRALDEVTLDFHRGEVHGLIGENGAGKSTVMHLLTGLLEPTAGTIRFEGRPVRLRGPAEAQRLGIAMVHQELNRVEALSVAANLFLGREPTRFGRIDHRRSEREARALLGRIGCTVDPRATVKRLSIAERQMVEIARALSLDARVLILDEPTAVLTQRETAGLFDLIGRLKAAGTTIIYISHRLPEVRRLCDRITVLRDGRLVTTLAGEERRAADERQLANLMVGRPPGEHFPERPRVDGPVVLEVDRLCSPGAVQEVSFSVRAGEILGFAGLVGAGRTELGEAIAGLREVGGGRVIVEGEPLPTNDPRAAVGRGVAYLSEDRRGRGLVLGMSIAANITLASLGRHGALRLDREAERRATARRVEQLNIKLGSPTDPVRTLSGGNQQKVVLAKWLETEPRVLILDEPTRGVDVGAKEEIYRLIRDLAAAGLACVLISSEMNELIGLAHRIAAMRGGRLVATLDGPTATERQIMAHAAGVRDVEGQETDRPAADEKTHAAESR